MSMEMSIAMTVLILWIAVSRKLYGELPDGPPSSPSWDIYRSPAAAHEPRDYFPLPTGMVLCVTHACNYNCAMCTGRKTGARAERDAGFWASLISETDHKTSSGKSVEYVLFGGEPLLYGDIDALWKYLQVKEINTMIVTNGSWLGEFADRFLRSPCIRLTISLDGLGDIHDAIRGCNGAFDAIDSFLKYVNRRAPQALSRVSVNCVLQPTNLSSRNHLPELAFYLDKHQIRDVRFQHIQSFSLYAQKETNVIWRQLFFNEAPLFEMNDVPGWLHLDRTHIANLRAALKELKRRGLLPYILPDLTERDMDRYYDHTTHYWPGDGKCMRYLTPFILPDGSLSMCPVAGYSAGKLFCGEDFWKVFYSKRARAFRSSLLESGGFPICSRCCEWRTYR
jgi:MoaA/NifB/PqqE/SkfB family radical SAM enzyme